MKRMIISTILALCAGCSTYKAEEAKEDLKKDVVSITIHLDGDRYFADVKWTEINPTGGAEEVVAKAETTGLLNSWSNAKAIDTSSAYRSKVTVLLDSEVVEIGGGDGATFGIFAKKQDGKIYAKGLFVVTARDRNMSCSFEGYFKPGEPQIVYAKSEFRGEDAVEPIEQGPFKKMEGGTPLFK